MLSLNSITLAQIALYGRSAEVLMHEDAQGWELEKGSNVSFFVQSVSDDTSLDLCGGVIFDGNIIAEVKIMTIYPRYHLLPHYNPQLTHLNIPLQFSRKG